MFDGVQNRCAMGDMQELAEERERIIHAEDTYIRARGKMTEDRRRSAEIRRMASQKVAAEIVKGGSYITPEDARKHFIETVDWLDADVVAAGDRAERPSKPLDPPPLPSAPPNGAEGVSGAGTASERLTDEQAERMEELLGRIDAELLKLKLWDLELPQTTIPEAVKVMTKGQAKQIVAWMKEQKETA